MSTRVPKWGRFVSLLREKAGLSRRQLALLAGIDPSYMTLIENSGQVPKGDIADKILQAVTRDKLKQDQGMMLAGFAPRNVPMKDILAEIKRIHESRNANADTGFGGESPSVVLED